VSSTHPAVDEVLRVAGGFLQMSDVTRDMPGTSLTPRRET
jgi:hypothetical protein